MQCAGSVVIVYEVNNSTSRLDLSVVIVDEVNNATCRLCLL